MSDSLSSIVAAKAPVVPRACREGSTAGLPLEQLVLPFVRRRATGAIFVLGPPGSGKTTALEHLRAVLPSNVRIGYFDEPQYDHWQNVAHEIIAIVASTKPSWFPALATFNLANWTADDWVEYLAHTHRDQCAALMQRLSAGELAMLGGCPQLVRVAIDRMAADRSLSCVSDAVRRHLWDLLPPGVARNNATNLCLLRLKDETAAARAKGFSDRLSDDAVRFLRHKPAQQVLCADAIATMLCEGHVSDHLHTMASREMIRQLAAAVRLRPAAAARLDSLFDQSKRRYDAMAASILLAVNPDWRPRDGRKLQLRDALLREAHWSEVDLTLADLTFADLTGADLRLADMTSVTAEGTRFAGANLHSATLTHADLYGAVMPGIDLSFARAERAQFERADLTGGNLWSAKLPGASFVATTLQRVDFRQADLSSAKLADVDVADADFTDADLTNATLSTVKMCTANWTHAEFAMATLQRCDLQDLELPGADFEQASLRECDLTGTRIPGGNFRGARLCGAGLADIEWEGADLRDADFTYASFHMGSTRCGLVGSDIPCEGSKTGFYTDDYDEHDHLPPEEIRKANLCGADLRGAKVFDTDFYLVDLRGAKYTHEQEEHFAKCRAILHSKVA